VPRSRGCTQAAHEHLSEGSQARAAILALLWPMAAADSHLFVEAAGPGNLEWVAAMLPHRLPADALQKALEEAASQGHGDVCRALRAWMLR